VLNRIKHVSRFSQPMTRREVVELADTAARRSAAQGITGALRTSGGLFLQVIEERAEVVDTLYGPILRDERHRDVPPLAIDDFAQDRLCPDWGMQRVDLDDGAEARLEPLRAMLNAILSQRVPVQEPTGALERAVTREQPARR
jgi:hypothetical protein